MKNTPLFVDLSNFYCSLVRSGLDTKTKLRDFFLTWLDFDIVARMLTGSSQTIWIFYSGKAIGSNDAKISGVFITKYIDRINNLEGITAYDVNIPGSQRENIKHKCKNCNAETDSEWKSEKGIDASMIVHLFDTMEWWDTCYILTGDADFVPAVKSLRRKGKIVIGVGFSGASNALIRECYNYIDLPSEFIKSEIVSYNLFNSEGILIEWFRNVKPYPEEKPKYNLSLYLTLTQDEAVSFSSHGSYDDSHIQERLSKFKEIKRFFEESTSISDITPIKVDDVISYYIELEKKFWISINRRVEKFILLLRETEVSGIKLKDKMSIEKTDKNEKMISISYNYNNERYIPSS